MNTLTVNHLLALLAKPEPPCISLYQPTHRHHPENQQDPIRFKNLVRQIQESLRQKYPTRDVRELLKPLQDLAVNDLFWNHTWEGLAIFRGPQSWDMFPLQRSLPELAVVADSFNVKPLLRYLQSADRFQLLGLTRDRALLFEGNRYAVDAEVLPENFPAKRAMVVPPSTGERGVSVASSNTGVGGYKALHGHAADFEDIETEKFFRAVDRAVIDQFSKPSQLPLILVALPEHQTPFRRISHNTLLLPDGVQGNPESMKAEELRTRAWEVVEPYYLARLERLKESFSTAYSRQEGSADLADVARAAVAGRVATLLVEAERVIPGILDRESGAVQQGDLNSPDVEDMLDDLAELVLTRGGDVVVVPAERMPTSSGLAAIYRY